MEKKRKVHGRDNKSVFKVTYLSDAINVYRDSLSGKSDHLGRVGIWLVLRAVDIQISTYSLLKILLISFGKLFGTLFQLERIVDMAGDTHYVIYSLSLTQSSKGLSHS